MLSVSIIFLTLLAPLIHSAKPTLKLTFVPDEKYYVIGNEVEILCELIDPADHSESPHLWHVDLKTDRHTPISRVLLQRPTDDAAEVFKQNKLHRLEYVKKNHLRIRQILIEDSARYECTCPDCEEPVAKKVRNFQVMKLTDPRWLIDAGWPVQEHAKTIVKCNVEDFYPYVAHRILHEHRDITSLGKAVLPMSNTYPQKFAWEATLTPSADWHNTTLRCTITEGNHERQVVKILDIIFTPRFLTCAGIQYVNVSKDRETIECSYSGNPKPTLTWLWHGDNEPVTSDFGITVKEIDEHHGKYKSIVTFERHKLESIPLTTTTRASDDLAETTLQPIGAPENYYQQLLNAGFIARLTYNGEIKNSRTIHIVRNVHPAYTNPLGSSAARVIENLPTSILLLFVCSLSILRYMVCKH